MTQDYHLFLQPSKRLKTCLLCKGGFLKQDQKSREQLPSVQKECYLIILALLYLGIWRFSLSTFFVVSLLCNLNKILQGTEENSSITSLSSFFSVALELNGYLSDLSLCFSKCSPLLYKNHQISLSTGIQVPTNLGIHLYQQLTTCYVFLELASSYTVS